MLVHTIRQSNDSKTQICLFNLKSKTIKKLRRDEVKGRKINFYITFSLSYLQHLIDQYLNKPSREKPSLYNEINVLQIEGNISEARSFFY